MPLNATQAAMLGLLHDGQMTGGELNDLAQKWLAPYWNMTRSQVYRELLSMDTQGYIKAGPVGFRNSVPYKVTASGKRAFQAWLKLDPNPDLLRSETMLRFALGGLHKGKAIQDLLNWMRNHNELAVDKITDLLSEAHSEGMEYDAQSLRFALMYHQMIIGWLETVELPD